MNNSATQPSIWFKGMSAGGAVVAALYALASWLEHKVTLLGPPKSAAEHELFVSDLWTALGIVIGSVILGQLATLVASRDRRMSESRYWSERYRNEIRS